MADDFKPNIYPIMYWGLTFGLVASFVLFLVNLLSSYLGLIWFPVFIAGVVWGGYRNYQKQKKSVGPTRAVGTPIEEFKEAASDIVSATRDMIAEQRQEALEAEQVPLQEEPPAQNVPAPEAPDNVPAQRDVAAPAPLPAPVERPVTPGKLPNESVEDSTAPDGNPRPPTIGV